MNEFRFLLVWIAFFALVQQYIVLPETIMVRGHVQKKWGFFWAVVLFFPIFHLAALGPVIGDVGGYLSLYQRLPETWSEIWDFARSEESGSGFILFEGVIKIVFGNNVTAFRVILAACQSIPIILLYRKYSDDYLISVFLFVATCSHIAWMMNGLRQFLAAVIIYAATPLMIKKKYLFAAVIVLLAATIHTSAIVMLPVIFIAPGKAWNKRTILYIVLAIIAMFVFSRNMEFLNLLLAGTEYENSVSMWQELGDDGVNPIRVLVSAVPLVLALVSRNHMDIEDDTTINFLINMSVINFGIYLIAMVTSGIMIGRLPGYTGLYNHILLPNLLNRAFEEDSKRLLTWVMVFFYLIYFWYSRGFR